MESKIIIAESERLILRRYKKEDIQDLFEYLSDKEVVKYEPYKPLSFDEAKENLEWCIGTDEMIAVELKNSHKMIGNVYMGKRDFEALEIGYVSMRTPTAVMVYFPLPHASYTDFMRFLSAYLVALIQLN